MPGIAGVRFDRAGRVHYYAADEPLAVGDAVVVDTPNGPAIGRVVIAPDQVVLSELPEPPSVVARKTSPPCPPNSGGGAGAVSAFAPRSSSSPPPQDWGGSKGGPSTEQQTGGQPGAGGAELGYAARLAASLGERNREYLERKLRLPRLGAVVETVLGRGRVVQVNVVRERVTVEREDGSPVELVGPDLAPAPPEEPRAERPRGRRRRRRRPAGEARAPGE